MIGPKAYIHLDRLIDNYHLIKNHLGNQRLVSVVKANGYGHGAVGCAKALEKAGCDYFAVFTFGEAMELRQVGIKGEILVFSRMDSANLSAVVEHNIVLNISSPDDINILLEFNRKTGTCPRTHLKVDTGMTRLGVPMEEAESLILKLKEHPEILCEGLYSHLATADEGDLAYANQQSEKFNQVVNLAKDLGFSFQYIHLSNSGAVLNLDQSPYNLVRVGMLLYGAFPSAEVPRELGLRPVMEFKAPIVALREVKSGTQVSYGGVYTTEKNTTIGVIQCGFADGFPRPWNEEGHVMYHGKKYRIAGRICMDQFMVDFAGDNPTVGDEILLIGEGSDGSIKADDIAQKIDSTTYVIFTAIGGRTEYVYV